MRIENYLVEASATGEDYSKAINNMFEAYNLSEEILKGKEEVGARLTTTWEKSRFEKCRSVNGREFVYVMDDVKDHFADRRLGLEYMMAPFERMEIDKWQNQLMEEINNFAKAHNVPISGLTEDPLNE